MTPRISVIIPTFDRPTALHSCLHSLTQQTLGRDSFEVVVVDDGSAMPLDGVVGAFSDRLHIMLRRQQRSGPGAARNTGAQYASGRWLAFTDDDCRPNQGWLLTLLSSLERHGTAIVGGRTVNALTANKYSATSQMLVSHLFEYFNADPLNAAFFTSNNMGVSADRFRDAGGFALRYPILYAEDRELCDRWRSFGWPLVYAVEAVVRHSHHMTLARFIRQHFLYGRGAFAYHRIRAVRQSGRFRLEPISFYQRLVTMPFSGGVANPLTISTLLAAAQAANACGFFREAMRREQRAYDRDLAALSPCAGGSGRSGSSPV